jgi:hypothetical protein
VADPPEALDESWATMDVWIRDDGPLASASPLYKRHRCSRVIDGYCIIRYSYGVILVIPVVPHKAVAEVSKIGNL